jgi:hypothetical protein
VAHRERERERKRKRVCLTTSVRDWKFVCGLILMHFKYVAPDDKSYVLTGVDCWNSSLVTWLLIPTW